MTTFHADLVQDRSDLACWLLDLLRCGSLWNDAVLVAAAWRGEAVEDLAEAMKDGMMGSLTEQSNSGENYIVQDSSNSGE